MKELFIFITSLTLASVLAAKVSILVRSGTIPFYWTIMASIVPAVVWSLAVRYATRNLSSLSLLYDIVANLAWIAVLLYNGEVFTVKQWIGVFLFFVALFFVA
jgi:hypothetical protein